MFDSSAFFYSFNLVEKIRLRYGIEDVLIEKLLSSGFIFNFETNTFQSKYIFKYDIGDIEVHINISKYTNFDKYSTNINFSLVLQNNETGYSETYSDDNLINLLFNFHIKKESMMSKLGLLVKIKRNFVILNNKINFNREMAIFPPSMYFDNINRYYGNFLYGVDNYIVVIAKERNYRNDDFYNYQEKIININQLDINSLEELITYQEYNIEYYSNIDKKNFKTFILEEKYDLDTSKDDLIITDEQYDLNLIHLYDTK